METSQEFLSNDAHPQPIGLFCRRFYQKLQVSVLLCTVKPEIINFARGSRTQKIKLFKVYLMLITQKRCRCECLIFKPGLKCKLSTSANIILMTKESRKSV